MARQTEWKLKPLTDWGQFEAGGEERGEGNGGGVKSLEER